LVANRSEECFGFVENIRWKWFYNTLLIFSYQLSDESLQNAQIRIQQTGKSSRSYSIAIGRELENPNNNAENIATSDHMSVGFVPIRPLILAHWGAIINSPNVKTETIMPAYIAAFWSLESDEEENDGTIE
jgi:hypothetical protein